MRNNKPSATALLILKSMVFLSTDSYRRDLVPEDMSKISARFLETKTLDQKGFIKIFKRKWFRPLIWFLERLLLPGIILHYVLRKRYIEEIIFRIINNGKVKQIVILAAGFDSLACRLSQRFPGISFIEIDHPATQESKKKVLLETGLQSPNLIFLAADLSRERWEDRVLSMKTFDPQAGTLFIAEGITMYLNKEQIQQLFSFVSKYASPGSQFIFTFMERRDNGVIDFKHTHPFVNLWLDWKKERFKWGISQRELPGFLKERKFSFAEMASSDTLRSKYFSALPDNEPLAEGECIYVARVD